MAKQGATAEGFLPQLQRKGWLEKFQPPANFRWTALLLSKLTSVKPCFSVTEDMGHICTAEDWLSQSLSEAWGLLD